MPRTYPIDVRRQLCDRMLAGEPVVAIAAETGISQATLFNWKKQALIDGGTRPGVPSVEADEPAAARKRITQLGSGTQTHARCMRAVQRASGGAPKTPTRDR